MACVCAVLCLMSAGCTRTEHHAPEYGVPDEISVRCVTRRTDASDGGTRGYVTGIMLRDLPVADLHTASADPSPRDIVISSYVHPQTGEAATYFTGALFRESSGTGLWHNYSAATSSHEPLYWPIGGDLDFLAFSTGADSRLASDPGATVAWDEFNAARRVTLHVASGDCLGNDILYSAAVRKFSSDPAHAGGSLQMEFRHGQAWLSFRFTGPEGASGDATPAVTVTSLTVSDVFTSGDLIIYGDEGRASAYWELRTETADDLHLVSESDPLELYGSDPAYVDVLLPEQKRTSIVLTYRLGASPKVFTYRMVLEHATWLIGTRYTYAVNFNLKELTIVPTEDAWDGVTVK